MPFATTALPTWAQQASFLLPLEPPTSSSKYLFTPATDDDSHHASSSAAETTAVVEVDVLVQGFADYIWVIVKEAAARTHGVVAHGAVAGVARGALDVPLDGAHRPSAEGGHHDDDEFPSDDENEGAASRFTAQREENAASTSPSAIASINLGRNAPMPPVESEVLLGSRDEALVNVLNNALVGSIALHTGDARPVVSCITLHGLAKSLKSPAAKQYAVSRIVAEVVAVSKAALR
ncbi:GPI-anchored surface protein, putative [Bodo saltans]|uniref:GPI-anchored surface protein, putative n=1 Tax=Bodo saltans TaxID=75058 RepID=A0A0S4J437_BODSA|nr:GPI-anchored surface protein, putative [Bodo saltans]|eukprot:CUG86206.1 GPI-anchored surface protein, putative [Bodo saltans]